MSSQPWRLGHLANGSQMEYQVNCEPMALRARDVAWDLSDDSNEHHMLCSGTCRAGHPAGSLLCRNMGHPGGAFVSNAPCVPSVNIALTFVMAAFLSEIPFPVGRRRIAVVILAIITFITVTTAFLSRRHYFSPEIVSSPPEPQQPRVYHLREPDWSPPSITDPWLHLESSLPLPVPSWNKPKPSLHHEYGLDFAPPLFIGFTRTWPILLQAVVSYIAAGWPPEQIYVVENTGVQTANARGKLTLQNPFYLNHHHLETLGVNVIEAPVRMSFSQLQNYYMYLSREHGWPYYFWSHMDVLVLSYEDGHEGVTPPASEPGYKSIYELALNTLRDATQSEERWALKFFSYDHLTLVNRAAYEDLGGWDTFIPFYMNDCDFHSRIIMRNWTAHNAYIGRITDVSTVLQDLRALFRFPHIEPNFTDPNPPAPESSTSQSSGRASKREELEPDLAYWIKLRDISDRMFDYKHGDRERNVWMLGQHGGQGEPFYYDSRGFEEAIEVMWEAGKEVFRRKWGHRGCGLIEETALRDGDQWHVEQDWDRPS